MWLVWFPEYRCNTAAGFLNSVLSLYHVGLSVIPLLVFSIDANIMCLQFMKELDASTSEVSELESKLSAAQRRIQKQAEEQEEAGSARAQQGQQLNALAQDMQALQSSLERVKQDRQQVCLCALPCRTMCATGHALQMLLLCLQLLCHLRTCSFADAERCQDCRSNAWGLFASA